MKINQEEFDKLPAVDAGADSRVDGVVEGRTV